MILLRNIFILFARVSVVLLFRLNISCGILKPKEIRMNGEVNHAVERAVKYCIGTFFYFVHVVNIVILAHTLAPGVVVTFLVMLVIAVVGATMGVVSGSHVLSAKAASVVLETEVFKTLFLTFFSTSTRQTAKH